MAFQKSMLVVILLGIFHSTRAAPPDINECTVNNGGCNPGETCIKTPGSFTCAYLNGLSTVAGYVCFDINECLTNNGGCSEEATCANTPGSFTCNCRQGYTGNGLNCSDIDECLVNNGGCSRDAVCTNSPGSFTCACKRGFSGNGFTCTDSNECSTNNGGCNPLATCFNIHGSYTCTCNIGYYGNGFSCYDYNECLSNNGGCSHYATCSNTIGSSYCTCKPGYTGNGFVCSATAISTTSVPHTTSTSMPSTTSEEPVTDYNECLWFTAKCSYYATCTNTLGSYYCTCKPGYTGDGFLCLDYNECLSNNGGCSHYATCSNTFGSYYCTCKPGYTGNGFVCSATAISTTSASHTTSNPMPSRTSEEHVSVNETVLHRDCADLRAMGHTSSGVYTVDIGGSLVEVYCDMTTSSLGWTVFQRRQDGSVDFYRNWTDYQHGFGDVSGEFWIGNDNLHLLTAGKRYKLRVDLTALDGSTGYAEFDSFKVASAADWYRLSSIGTYSGTAGDSLSYNVGQQFTTFDQDNDSHGSYNCAVGNHGAWWYGTCGYSNLNGKYYKTQTYSEDGVYWQLFKGPKSMERSEMKITPFI